MYKAHKAFFFVFFVAISFIFSGPALALDKTKYIGVDEIKDGMDAYCYTVLEGTKIKKYPLKVLSVVYNTTPGRDSILVMGTDESFKHVGPVQGCSGSPVYIDGRMAGALAAGWSFSTDPLYRVTPIEDMLEVGSKISGTNSAPVSQKAGLIDYSASLDIASATDQFFAGVEKLTKASTSSGSLPCPLLTSLPGSVCDELAVQFASTGIVPLSGAGIDGFANYDQTTDFAPGGVVTIPLVSGDISLAVAGTMTEKIGDKVYAFGHSFLGYGEVDLPMAGGKVHTVVSNMNFSFKLASPGKIIGAIRADEQPGVYGEVGAEAALIPMKITVNRFNAKPMEYNCMVATNKLYTPIVTQIALAGAAQMQGPLPLEHFVEYKASIGVKGHEAVSFENISSGKSVREVVSEATGVIALLMNNPYEEVELSSLNFEIDISPADKQAKVFSVQLDDTTVKAGETVDATVVLQSLMSRKSVHRMKLDIPKDLRPGQYKVGVTGTFGFMNFLRKSAPYKFNAIDVPSMIEALNYILSQKRDKLYMYMAMPSGGVVIDKSELPDLASTKTMLLGDPTRTVNMLPFGNWIKHEKDIPSIIADQKIVTITVTD